VLLLLLPLIGLFVLNYLDQSSPRHLPKPPTTRIVVGPRKVTPKIAASGLHLVVLVEDGSLWGVGYNDWGQAGGKTTGTMAWTNQFDTFPGGSDWVDVAAGGQATFAIRDDGTLWQWGAASGGLCVFPKNGPVQIGTATNWSAISAAGGIFGLRSDGTLWAWGNNSNGELGLASGGSQTNPVPLTTDADWAGLAAGSSVSAAVKSNGTVWAWGHIMSGSRFDGTLKDIGIRTPFRLGTNASFVRVQCLMTSVLAEDRSGRLWECALSGAPEQVWRSLPDVPNSLGSWSAGGFVIVALDQTGKAWVSGRNRLGVLANRWVRKTEEWLPVEGVEGGAAGMAGWGCAVLAKDGELLLWGRRFDDSEGQIENPFDRARVWLSRYVPSLKPRGYGRTPAFEIVPWTAAEFVRTNEAAANPAR
jgi:alpha-tubulin suppressor-like RCC1 family protein